MKTPFKKPAEILNKLAAHGYEAYFVGGAVRDLILGREISDVDIATSATPEEVVALFHKTLPLGIEHGTVAVEHDGTYYEVTTFRTESGYEDFRRPSNVHFVRSLEDDLQRRDFTINAIAMTTEGEFVDPFNGTKDILNQTIRTVGLAEERFNEDALRMMRAVRFVGQLGFSLDESTKQAIQLNANHIAHVAIERIKVELEKLFLGSFKREGLLLMEESGLLYYFPHFSNNTHVFTQIAKVKLDEVKTVAQHWALLLYYLDVNEHDIDVILTDWKLSRKLRHEVVEIVKVLNHVVDEDWSSELIYRFTKTRAESAARLKAAINHQSPATDLATIGKIASALPIQSRSDLRINGNHLQLWSEKKPGPWMSDVLEKVELEVLNGKLANEETAIKEWLSKCNLL